MSVIALRPAMPADSEFCFELHKAAMGDYITAIWGWNHVAELAAREPRRRCVVDGRP